MANKAGSLKPDLEALLLLEQPFARLPHEELRRQLRTHQRLVERDLTFCATTLTDLAGGSSSSGKASGDASPSKSNAAVRTKAKANEAAAAAAMRRVAAAQKQQQLLLQAAGGDTTMAESSSQKSADAMSIDEGSGAATPITPDSDLQKTLDVMLGRLRGLKRKLSPLAEQTERTLQVAQARTEHLADLHRIESTASAEFQEWSRIRLDRMLADYMLRQGYTQAAAELARSRGIEQLVDLDVFAEITRIESSLVPPGGSGSKPSCTAALAWCSDNKAVLRKMKSTLEFDLRLQEFIELARVRELRDAIAYAQKHLLPVYNREVSRAMGLLAMSPGKWAYNDLYSAERWLVLRSTFRECALQIHSLPAQPVLHMALSAGLSALKLPACYSHEPRLSSASTASGSIAAPVPLVARSLGEAANAHLAVAAQLAGAQSGSSSLANSSDSMAMSGVLAPSSPAVGAPLASNPGAVHDATRDPNDARNANCPVCDTQALGQLAREVPWSQHANSTLVCRISGKVMDENNPPLCLPNGRVYSRSALEEMAASNAEHLITCPRTGQTFTYASLRKVYIS